MGKNQGAEWHSMWAELTTAVSAHARHCAEGLYRAVSKGALQRMEREAAGCSGLRDHDEQLYVHCTRLLEAYKETVGLYERYRVIIITPNVKEIMDGIVTVLLSRLREFDESTNGINPITEEKNAIIAKTIDSYVRVCGRLWKSFAEYELPKVCLRWLAKDLNKDVIEEAVKGFCFPTLYEAYRNGLTQCRTQLNDLNQRKQVQRYWGLMTDELEILATIIRIQVQALESEIEESGPREQRAIQQILTVLREAYQHFGRAEESIDEAFRQLIIREPEQFEEFEAYLISRMIHKGIEEQLQDEVRRFREVLEREADILLSQYTRTFAKSIYKFQRMVNDEVMLAEEMAGAFARMRNEWPEGGEDENGDILRGVAETMEIKIEGLRESSRELHEDCRQTINSFAAQRREPEESVYDTVWQLWLEDPDEFGEASREIPYFTELGQHYEKISAQCASALEKKLLKFKRETVLYEVSTYEEIILYSVSRLRQDESLNEAVAIADETLRVLEILLKKNNIQVIRPQPHDFFNAKEHEVLMAENSPDFKKGEIIKLMNSGYRQKDTVILRANVIAAR